MNGKGVVHHSAISGSGSTYCRGIRKEKSPFLRVVPMGAAPDCAPSLSSVAVVFNAAAAAAPGRQMSHHRDLNGRLEREKQFLFGHRKGGSAVNDGKGGSPGGGEEGIRGPFIEHQRKPTGLQLTTQQKESIPTCCDFSTVSESHEVRRRSSKGRKDAFGRQPFRESFCASITACGAMPNAASLACLQDDSLPLTADGFNNSRNVLTTNKIEMPWSLRSRPDLVPPLSLSMLRDAADTVTGAESTTVTPHTSDLQSLNPSASSAASFRSTPTSAPLLAGLRGASVSSTSRAIPCHASIANRNWQLRDAVPKHSAIASSPPMFPVSSRWSCSSFAASCNASCAAASPTGSSSSARGNIGNLPELVVSVLSRWINACTAQSSPRASSVHNITSPSHLTIGASYVSSTVSLSTGSSSQTPSCLTKSRIVKPYHPVTLEEIAPADLFNTAGFGRSFLNPERWGSAQQPAPAYRYDSDGRGAGVKLSTISTDKALSETSEISSLHSDEWDDVIEEFVSACCSGTKQHEVASRHSDISTRAGHHDHRRRLRARSSFRRVACTVSSGLAFSLSSCTSTRTRVCHSATSWMGRTDRVSGVLSPPHSLSALALSLSSGLWFVPAHRTPNHRARHSKPEKVVRKGFGKYSTLRADWQKAKKRLVSWSGPAQNTWLDVPAVPQTLASGLNRFILHTGKKVEKRKGMAGRRKKRKRRRAKQGRKCKKRTGLRSRIRSHSQKRWANSRWSDRCVSAASTVRLRSESATVQSPSMTVNGSLFYSFLSSSLSSFLSSSSSPSMSSSLLSSSLSSSLSASVSSSRSSTFCGLLTSPSQPSSSQAYACAFAASRPGRCRLVEGQPSSKSDAGCCNVPCSISACPTALPLPSLLPERTFHVSAKRSLQSKSASPELSPPNASLTSLSTHSTSGLTVDDCCRLLPISQITASTSRPACSSSSIRHAASSPNRSSFLNVSSSVSISALSSPSPSFCGIRLLSPPCPQNVGAMPVSPSRTDVLTGQGTITSRAAAGFANTLTAVRPRAHSVTLAPIPLCSMCRAGVCGVPRSSSCCRRLAQSAVLNTRGTRDPVKASAGCLEFSRICSASSCLPSSAGCKSILCTSSGISVSALSSPSSCHPERYLLSPPYRRNNGRFSMQTSNLTCNSQSGSPALAGQLTCSRGGGGPRMREGSTSLNLGLAPSAPFQTDFQQAAPLRLCCRCSGTRSSRSVSSYRNTPQPLSSPAPVVCCNRSWVPQSSFCATGNAPRRYAADVPLSPGLVMSGTSSTPTTHSLSGFCRHRRSVSQSAVHLENRSCGMSAYFVHCRCPVQGQPLDSPTTSRKHSSSSPAAIRSAVSCTMQRNSHHGNLQAKLSSMVLPQRGEPLFCNASSWAGGAVLVSRPKIAGGVTSALKHGGDEDRFDTHSGRPQQEEKSTEIVLPPQPVRSITAASSVAHLAASSTRAQQALREIDGRCIANSLWLVRRSASSEEDRTMEIRREIRLTEAEAVVETRRKLNIGLSDVDKYRETLLAEAQWLCEQEEIEPDSTANP